jgi:hypothetical protein
MFFWSGEGKRKLQETSNMVVFSLDDTCHEFPKRPFYVLYYILSSGVSLNPTIHKVEIFSRPIVRVYHSLNGRNRYAR